MTPPAALTSASSGCIRTILAFWPDVGGVNRAAGVRFERIRSFRVSAVVLLVALALPVSARAEANPHQIALAYVRAHVKTLGLKNLDTLEPPTIIKAGDVTQVRWRQGVDGVTA